MAPGREGVAIDSAKQSPIRLRCQQCAVIIAAYDKAKRRGATRFRLPADAASPDRSNLTRARPRAVPIAMNDTMARIASLSQGYVRCRMSCMPGQPHCEGESKSLPNRPRIPWYAASHVPQVTAGAPCCWRRSWPPRATATPQPPRAHPLGRRQSASQPPHRVRACSGPSYSFGRLVRPTESRGRWHRTPSPTPCHHSRYTFATDRQEWRARRAPS